MPGANSGRARREFNFGILPPGRWCEKTPGTAPPVRGRRAPTPASKSAPKAPHEITRLPAKKLTLWSLSWPLFVEQGLRISIGTVDTLMVSHVSDNAVAGLGVAWQVVILTLILFNFIGIGSSVVITHHLGAGDRAGADRISRAA